MLWTSDPGARGWCETKFAERSLIQARSQTQSSPGASIGTGVILMAVEILWR
jgi:hypothetical protein